ncbi:MAG: hypothetical protein LBD90_03255 [Bifidobacteriaceae bacterium]|jgi:fatty acid desaturase|nr:hypothetical protein [Bifidobacteriaceae bacterium]
MSQPTATPLRPPFKTGPRPAVIIWGAVIALIGMWAILGASGFSFSGQLALIILLTLAGLTLVASAAIAAVRRPKG